MKTTKIFVSFEFSPLYLLIIGNLCFFSLITSSPQIKLLSVPFRKSVLGRY